MGREANVDHIEIGVYVWIWLWFPCDNRSKRLALNKRETFLFLLCIALLESTQHLMTKLLKTNSKKNITNYSVASRVTSVAFWILAEIIKEWNNKTMTTFGREALTIIGNFPCSHTSIVCLSLFYPSLECVPAIKENDLITAYIITSMFYVLWLDGESSNEIGKEVQEVSQWSLCPVLPLQQNLQILGKRTYIIFATSQWAYSWHSAVYQGISRRMARARVARAGAARGTGVVATRGVVTTRV